MTQSLSLYYRKTKQLTQSTADVIYETGDKITDYFETFLLDIRPKMSNKVILLL